MGYSEVHCTLCGVSFNLCRIRTPNEPREYAWNYYGSSKPGTSFIEVIDTCDFYTGCTSADQAYPGQEGCMIAFREDEALQSRGMRGTMRRGREGKTWDDLVFAVLESERVDLGEDQGDDDDWVPGEDVEDGDRAVDSEIMECEDENESEALEEDARMENEEDHENGTDNGIHDYGEDAKMEEQSNDEDESCDTDSNSEYHTWTSKVLTSAHLDIYGYQPNSTDLEHAQRFEKLRCLAEEFRVKVPKEARLPLHVSIETIPEPLRSEIEQGQHDGYVREDKKLVSSILNHPLNSLGSEGECWEHLAGPDCRSTRGYHGSRVSIAEMLNCNVAQSITEKDSDKSWEPESTDEDWEGEGDPGWSLTGLVDCLSGRGDGGDDDPYPERHPDGTQNGVIMDNIRFDIADVLSVAMAFHPTCLEVFKRASWKKYGRVDINALGNWWKASADYKYMDKFPRAKEVKDGEDQWWTHHVGDEYLAANPCFIPSLKGILEFSRKSQTPDAKPRILGHGRLSTLPVEIQRFMMFCLDPIDIASLSIAFPELRTAAQGVLQSSLLVDMPYLWEFWCDKPYSRWVGTTAAKIKADIDAFNEQEIEIQRVLNILEEEGYHEERAQYKQYWDNNREERRRISQLSFQEKPADLFDVQQIDLVEFVLRLNKARSNGELKGLRNRERIWTDCDVILNRIEDLQEEGIIPPAS